MTCFWRDEKLSNAEEELIGRLFEAHQKSAMRNNPSSVALQMAFQSNGGDFLKAVSASLGTLGGKHGPIVSTYDFLERGDVRKWLELGLLIPGWGSSFPLPDEDWTPVEMFLENWPEVSDRINSITAGLLNNGRVVLPNPSCFTAAVAKAVGIPKHLSPMLFLMARLPAYGKMCL